MAEKAVFNALKQDYKDRVALGYERMRELRVAVCATVRDCAEPLEQNIPFVERLQACFAASNVIIVENDSVDGTKAMLAEWQQRDNRVALLGEDTGTVTIPAERTGSENPWFSKARIEKMARFRNEYLAHIESMPKQPDFMIVLDLDVAEFYLDGVAHSFGQDQTWDMVGANGRRFPDRATESLYFDTYAFRERGMPQPQTEKEIYASQTRMAALVHYMPLFAVDSAFGALGLYRYAAVRGHRYGCVPNDDPEVTVLSEHPCLHLAMRQQGHDRIFVNPNMIVHYNKPQRRASLLVDRSLPRI